MAKADCPICEASDYRSCDACGNPIFEDRGRDAFGRELCAYCLTDAGWTALRRGGRADAARGSPERGDRAAPHSLPSHSVQLGLAGRHRTIAPGATTARSAKGGSRYAR